MSFIRGFVKIAKPNSKDKTTDGDRPSKLLTVGLPTALAGLGTYAMLRRKRLHGPKAIQEIQKKSDRVVKIVPKDSNPKYIRSPGLFDRLKRALDPTEYMHTGSKDLKQLDTSNTALIDLDGAGRHKDSINHVSNKTRKWVKKNLGYDKVREQEWVKNTIGENYAIPTKTVSQAVGRRGTPKQKLERLRKRYGDSYFIKERGGVGGMESGSYVTPDVELTGKATPEQTEILRKSLSNRSGSKYVVQPHQNIQQEFRVHVLGNDVIPGFTMFRDLGSSDVVHTAEHVAAEKAVQKMLKNKKLPKGQLYGLDVARVGRNKYKIIETNPVDADGYSGMFDQDTGASLARHADLYKALTGRTAPYRAALAGGAAATGTGVVASQIDKFVYDSNKKPVKGPYTAENV